ncbi:asparagine synthase (glutamine-hydrolyzing) [Amycolatopsis sp. NPDC098790]|uniref:asparagine synthase (glutamine-hydrolyzing) n=1 Tax=Amycolatopsis sp. NPDC098790 TaxID=3363939 RepID=UPI0037FFFE0F
MCGIVAIHGSPDPLLGSRMLDRLTHRGPDDQGTAVLPGTWLGHRRLSIVDTDGGHQPLTDAAGNHLVGNGEIYNHADLRARFAGHRWSTGSDNEVALHLAVAGGGAALADLRGMFALAIAGPGLPFLAARDPVGVKPLYWARTPHSVVFASEMKAFDRAHRSRVRPFPPGCFWTPQEGLRRFAHAMPRHTTGPDAPAEHEAAVRAGLIASVHLQMMGDEPPGVLLSGGLDSSIVAAIAARWCRERGYRLRTFSVGTAESADLAAARRVAAHLGTEHFERTYTAEAAVDRVPDVVRAVEHYDPALLHSSVANHFLAELAAQHTKAVLTGEGADELFAGYRYLREFRDDNALDAELRRTVSTLHTLNLQRCDRTTMAFGLEARVPFLDTDFIATAMSVPVRLRRPDHGRREKHLLRKAFAGWLPDDLLWRAKEQFGDGSGMSGVLRDAMSGLITEADFQKTGHAEGIRNREELAYHRIWHRELAGISPRTLDRSMTL